jgi:hypothetical protein
MIAILLMTSLAVSSQAAPAPEQPALQCNIGPVTKRFGSNDWLVYGCTDGHSVVVIAETPNPATPYVFFLTPDGKGGVELQGEGTGAESATQPVYEALKTASVSDLATLFQLASQPGEP